jgi:hypothetical protein
MRETRFSKRSTLPVDADEAFAWHQRAGALERLTPPWDRVQVIERTGTIRNGDRTTIELRRGPLRRRWVALHRDFVPGRGFTDVQEKGPFASWTHTHRFEPGARGCDLVDEIAYRLPFGLVGRLAGGRLVSRMLSRTFSFRHRRLIHDLERHAMTNTKLSIAITGASGLIGPALAAFLATGGHDVVRIVRRPAGPGEVAWDPAAGTIDADGLSGVDAVVHLAGEPIGRRWTRKRRREIESSRRQGTTLLAEALASLDPRPRVLVSASAIGCYGSRADEILTEQSTLGDDFLADVCATWEAATQPARDAGIRVVTARMGVVLEALLPRLLLPFRLGLGGRLGSGRQWLSWVALDDVLGAVALALADDRLAGPVNVVAPNSVTNSEFTRTLGRVLHRPAPMRVPAAAVKLALGEMGPATVLASQRVVPERLLDTGFRFAYPELEPALRHVLGR